MNYYVVAKGHTPGIYTSWETCKKQIDKFKGAIYKKFNNHEQALDFLNNHLTSMHDVSDVSSSQDYYVYTDGACSNNGKSNAKAGIGIYFSENDCRNISKPVFGKQTNNVAELTAIIETYPIIHQDILLGKKITIVTDSDYSLKCIHNYGKKQNDNDWSSDIPNKELVKKIYTLYANLPNITFKHINSHTGKTDIHSIGNAKADELANLAIGITQKNDKIYLNVPFSKKDDAKKMGTKWDPKKKKWYIFSDNPQKKNLLSLYN